MTPNTSPQMDFRRGIINLVVAVAIGLAAILAHYEIERRSVESRDENKAQRIQDAFDNHDAQMRLMLSNIAELINDSSNTDTLRILNEADPHDAYSCYMFKGDELAYWHHALLPIENLRPRNINKPIIKADNGWYYIAHHAEKEYDLYALFRFRKHYIYNNDYLNSAYDESLGIDPRHSISLSEKTQGITIVDADGNYLLTIIEHLGRSISTLWSVISFVMLVIWFAAMVAAIIFAAKLIMNSRYLKFTLPASLLMLIGFYIWTVFVDAPRPFMTSAFFSPQTFAFNSYIPSLMSLLITAFLAFIFCFIAYISVPLYTVHYFIAEHNNGRSFFIVLIFVYLAYHLVSTCLSVMVMNSSDLTFYASNLDVSVSSLTKMGIIALLALGATLIMERVYGEACRAISPRRFLLTLGIFTLAACVVTYIIAGELRFSHFFFFVVLNVVYFVVKRDHPQGLEFSRFVWFMFLLSFIVTVRLTQLNYIKEHQNRDLLIDNLAFKLIREDDPIAEQLLLSIEKDIENDTLITTTLSNSSHDVDLASNIFSHLREKYFNGYFTKYSLQVIHCQGQHSYIEMSNSGEKYECYNYFDNLISQFGRRIENGAHFYMLNDNDGLPSYFGEFDYHCNDECGEPSRLFIELNAASASDEIGYPELLTNNRDRINTEQYASYSYAFYYGGKLNTHYGAYEYKASPAWIGNIADGERKEIEQNEYSHLVVSTSANQCIVLSYPLMTPTQFIANYSYIFIITFLIFTIALQCIKKKYRFIYGDMNLSERIQASISLFFMLVFIIVCIVSGHMALSRYQDQVMQSVSTKYTAMARILSREIGDLKSIEGKNMRTELYSLLTQASALLVTDAHIYSPQGKLLTSSKRELFMNGIVSPLINSEALEKIRTSDDQVVIMEENIGNMTHYSLYAPIINTDGNMIGIVNIPTFYDMKAVRNHMFTTLLPFTYAYLIIILMAIIFSYLLARTITKPLNAISNSIKMIGLQKKNEKISYPNPNDEIGILVTEHNRMIDELAYSAERLAASERESTWRQMARQIAHEIKNPLTPMKLNVQYLLRAWDEGRSDFGTFVHRIGKTLVEQIDQLAFVASEFSDLAKMQNNKPTRVDVADKLADTVMLFDKTENATVVLEQKTTHAYAYINAEQLTSVFNNLIKNALQAARDDEPIVVRATVERNADNIIVTIRDNGKGISAEAQDKIFRPNFTTKSTGMGLGLAITKTIIMNANGDIRFETEEGRGTTFFVTLPIS